MNRSAPNFSVVLSLLVLCCGQPVVGDRGAPTSNTTVLLPPDGSTISSYQVLRIEHNPSTRLRLRELTYDVGGEAVPIVDAQNSLRYESGVIEVTLNADRIPAESTVVQAVVEGESGTKIRLRNEYSINHRPILDLVVEAEPGQVVIDAGSTRDPDGDAIEFQWQVGANRFVGPHFSAGFPSIFSQPVLVNLTNGGQIFRDLIVVLPPNVPDGEPRTVKVPDMFRCTDLEVLSTGPSPLNGEVVLGPDPPAGTQLPVDGEMRLTRSYFVGFSFDVSGTIVHSEGDVLDEGQDVARSLSREADDPTKTEDARGFVRDEANRSELGDVEVDAPFPSTLPADGTHPTMVYDGYDDHPTTSIVPLNTVAGVGGIFVKQKGLVSDGTRNRMIWTDKPGIKLSKGAKLSHGAFYRAYFRSWMQPVLDDCEEHFLVEIEIDANGRVAKNELTMR